MSDKYLREEAAKSDTKMRPTPIPESNFGSYYECIREPEYVQRELANKINGGLYRRANKSNEEIRQG